MLTRGWPVSHYQHSGAPGQERENRGYRTGVSQKQQVIQEQAEQKGCEEGWPGRQGIGGKQDYRKCLVICQRPEDLSLCLRVSQALLERIPNRLPIWDDSRRMKYSAVRADLLNALPREPEAGFPHCRSSSAFGLTPKARTGSCCTVLRIHKQKDHKSALRKQRISTDVHKIIYRHIETLQNSA